MNMALGTRHNPGLIMDCTLRDGGYVNNWEFDFDVATKVMDGLCDAGVRYMELGIMGNGGIAGKSTKFADFKQMEPLLVHRKASCQYAVMVNQAEADKFQFPNRDEDTPDIIRIAFFKKECLPALKKARELKEKGYLVFLQAMATFMYSDQEFASLIAEVNKVCPAGFYMVDSFSTMYNDDVRRMKAFVLSRLDEDILFGFHAHNNIQMAYSNAIEFLSTEETRPLMVDGTIYGMGRGAGNVPTELLMEYSNKFSGSRYDILKVLEVFQKEIQPIFQKYYWGFSPVYYLTASKEINSVYGWYLTTHGVNDLKDINSILESLPLEVRYTLSRSAVDEAIETCKREKKS